MKLKFLLPLFVLAASSALAATESPVPIRTVAPVYPAELWHQNVSGLVSVSFLVDARGAVQDAKVEKTTNDAFSAPALDAVKKWKFKPAQRDGNAVPVRVTIPIKFSTDANS